MNNEFPPCGIHSVAYKKKKKTVSQFDGFVQERRNSIAEALELTMKLSYWCAILIAHQLLWQNMEVPVSIFQESPLAGEPRERLFHIHSVHRYQLCANYLYPSTLLWQINCCNL